jgi:propanediol utilization protein
MQYDNSSMSSRNKYRRSRHTPSKLDENAVLFDINEWDQDQNLINQSGDFGGNNNLTILSERQQIQIMKIMPRTPQLLSRGLQRRVHLP